MRIAMMWVGLSVLVACAAQGAEGGDGGTAPSDDAASGSDGAPSFEPTDAGVDTGTKPTDPTAGIYANTFTELYRFDPVSEKLTLVAPFTGCNDWLGTPTVWDIAIDGAGNCFATTTIGLWKVDLQTAVCTKVAGGTIGSYPPSENMSFVPKGTLDPNADTLIGYVSGSANPPTTTDPFWNSTYLTVATNPYAVGYSGIIGWEDVNDVVSVANGGTFALGEQSAYLPPNDCQWNCLVQVDPKTGTVLQKYGSVGSSAHLIAGLAYWAGIIYAFAEDGDVESIQWSGNTMTVTDVPVTPAGLKFMGAASTTAAPVTTSDGGGPPIVN